MQWLIISSISQKNVENAFFDQHLECPAPKFWWKYTTASKQPLMNININEIRLINSISHLLIIFGNYIRMVTESKEDDWQKKIKKRKIEKNRKEKLRRLVSLTESI